MFAEFLQQYIQNNGIIVQQILTSSFQSVRIKAVYQLSSFKSEKSSFIKIMTYGQYESNKVSANILQ